jgi:archaetidylinositol phosphate synthase
MSTAKREMAALLAAPERRALGWMAERMPAWVQSDHMTILGVLGSVGIAAGYALTFFGSGWLWLASGMLVVNWFGDSLDGTMARVRHKERPKYGYYLDHAVDAGTTVLIGVGIGLSPYVSMGLGLTVVILYLLLSINVYLEAVVFGVFHLAYGKFGPTEIRILLILANTVLFFAPALTGATPALVQTISNTVIAVACALMALFLLTRFGITLHKLSRIDPMK